MSINSDSLENTKLLLQEENFDFLIQRLIKEKKWSKSQAKEACQYYKNFLFLKLKYGEEHDLPPSFEIDEVWHNHILFTKEYIEFCNRVFGKYLQHNPAIEDDVKNYQRLFDENTQVLHYKEFGDFIYFINPYLIFHTYLNIFRTYLKNKIIQLRTKFQFLNKYSEELT